MGANDRKDANNGFEHQADEGQPDHYDASYVGQGNENEATSLSTIAEVLPDPEAVPNEMPYVQPTGNDVDQTKVMDIPTSLGWLASEDVSDVEHAALSDTGLENVQDFEPVSEQTTSLDVSVPLREFETASLEPMSLSENTPIDELHHDTDKPDARDDATLQLVMPNSELTVFDSSSAGFSNDLAGFDKEPAPSIPETAVPAERVTVSSAAASVRVSDAEFTQLLAEVKDRPERFQLWDRLEQVASKLDAAPVVARAYRQALQNDFDQQLAADLIERAAAYHDEWLEDPEPTFELLERVLEIDPSARWAFDRLSLHYTVEGRWQELLTLYDKVIAATLDQTAQLVLLEEAASVAKDCAGKPEQAVQYLTDVFDARPTDTATAQALERLLKHQQNYTGLIEFWNKRLQVLEGDEVLETLQQMALCWLEDLNDPNGALEVVEPLLRNSQTESTAAKLLETILGSPITSAQVRQKATDLLGDVYDDTDQWRIVVDGLRAALVHVDDNEKLEIHKQLVRRLLARDAIEEALPHLAALVVHIPQSFTDKVISQLLKGTLKDAVLDFRLKLDETQVRTMLHMAADIATKQPANAERAMVLYSKLIDDQPDDQEAIRRLGELYIGVNRNKDLIALRQHELGLAEDVDERLRLRLEIASLLEVVGEGASSVPVLRANLEERCDHEPTLHALTHRFTRDGQVDLLATMLREQAQKVQELGRSELAASLWMQAAQAFHHELEQPEAATECYERAVEIEPNIEALDALARLAVTRGEPHDAVGLLEQRLAMTPSMEQTPTVMRLAEAHLKAGQQPRALACLSSALANDPSDLGLRDMLAAMYRQTGAWSELSQLLLDGAKLSRDSEVRYRYLAEAARVLCDELESINQALPVLQQIVTLRPDDREARVCLAQAMYRAANYDEARALTEQLLEQYGRKRTPGRARLHLLLAQILYALGLSDKAIEQLEQGTSIDMGNLAIQHMLGRVYAETGQLEKAERAYHAVVLLLRRRGASTGDVQDASQVGLPEVLYDLHTVSKQLGATQRAEENLASALDTAALSAAEGERFEKVLRQRGDMPMLLRALERRLGVTQDPAEKASIWSAMAQTQEQLDQPTQALESVLAAIDTGVADDALYDRAANLANKTGAIDDYLQMLETSSKRVLEQGDKQLGCKLLMRLGQLQHHQFGKLDVAAQLFDEALATGYYTQQAIQERASVARAQNDAPTERQMLMLLIQGDDESDIEAMQDGPALWDALYRLTSLQLLEKDMLHRGVETLTRALELHPRYEEAVVLLQQSLTIERHLMEAVQLLEEIARATQDDALLLDVLERRAELDEIEQSVLQEGCAIAGKLQENTRLESLLLRAVDVAKQQDGNVRMALWAMIDLAELREKTGETKDAVGWLRAAAAVAEPEQAKQMCLHAAELAAGPLGDLQQAADTYEEMLVYEPTDPAIIKPLLAVLRKHGDTLRLEDALRNIASRVVDNELQCELLMEHALLLRDNPERQPEAIELLRQVLELDAGHQKAAWLLVELLQRQGQYEALEQLLIDQLNRCQFSEDTEQGTEFAVQLAQHYGEQRIDEAKQVYRDSLQWMPTSQPLLRGLALLLTSDHEAVERADMLERLLNTPDVDDPVTLALDLLEARYAQQDQPGLERALELAFAVAPLEPELLDYYKKMADALRDEALQDDDVDVAITKLRRAAEIYSERLNDAHGASELLSIAMEKRSDDFEILQQLVDALIQSEQMQQALDRVAAVIERTDLHEDARGQLHYMRAKIALGVQDYASAVNDLEQARELLGDEVLPDLHDAVLSARDSARDRYDSQAEREATLRLGSLLQQMGQPEEARDMLQNWIEMMPDDTEAIRAVLQMDRDTLQWERVQHNAARLVQLETGPARSEAALIHAEACDQLTQPEMATEGLELAFQEDPSNGEVRSRLRQAYEHGANYPALANLLLVEANYTQDETARFELLRDAGRMRMADFGSAASAIGPLLQALELQPGDFEVTILLADAYISANLIPETVQLLQQAIDQQGGRRSRELSALQHRMARAASSSDRNTELQWLLAAFESYPQNGDVAAELAEVAMELGQYDIALKGLRALATAKTPGPISRAMAFLKQAQISSMQGDDRKATFLAKKALSTDPECVEAQQFLDHLGAAGG